MKTDFKAGETVKVKETGEVRVIEAVNEKFCPPIFIGDDMYMPSELEPVAAGKRPKQTKKMPKAVKPGHAVLSLIFADTTPLNPYGYVGTSCLGPTGDKGYDDDILGFIKTRPDVNNFSGERLAAALKRMIDEGLVRSYKFGREYSEVVYVTVMDFFHREDRVEKGTPEEVASRIEAVKAVFQSLRADEISVDGLTVRAWWD